jgi:hypothetical protein
VASAADPTASIAMASRKGWFKHFILSTPARSHADLGALGSGADDIIGGLYFCSVTE